MGQPGPKQSPAFDCKEVRSDLSPDVLSHEQLGDTRVRNAMGARKRIPPRDTPEPIGHPDAASPAGVP